MTLCLADGNTMSGSPPLPVAPISALLAPAYLLDLGELSMAELRERRTQCALVESSVSYERQLIQGRLDIVRDEQNRRRADQGSTDVTGLVERLPEILTLHAHSVGVGRPPTFMFPVQLDQDRQERMNQIAPVTALGALSTQSTGDLSTMSGLLEAMEHEISSQRHELHAVFDHIQEEVIRRYKSGEVPIESAFSFAPDQPIGQSGDDGDEVGLDWSRTGLDAAAPTEPGGSAPELLGILAPPIDLRTDSRDAVNWVLG